MTFWYGSGSADPCLLLMDPNPANLLRTLFVAKSWSWGKAAFLCLKMRLGKNFRTKKKFWPVSDLDLNPGFGSGFESGFESESEVTSGRIRIRHRIRNFCFGSATLIFRKLWSVRYYLVQYNLSSKTKCKLSSSPMNEYVSGFSNSIYVDPQTWYSSS